MGFNRKPHYTRGLLLVGDSGGMVNPFNGEGIDYALESGHMAAETSSGARPAGGPARERVLEGYAAALDAAYGGYFTLGRVFAKMIGNPTFMKQATRYGLPRTALMRFTLKLMANLTDPRDGDVVGPGHQRAGQGRPGGLAQRPPHAPAARQHSRTRREPAMELYIPVLALGVLAAGFAIFSVVVSSLTGPKRYNRAKLDSYECGIEPTPQALGGGRFPVKYYITAMMFIVFDIEIVFLYPWAVYFDSMKVFGLVEMVLFILTVFVAYAYVWRRGGLDWD